ncbi:MAG: tyrosine-protein phosphatase [Pseudomonadota bacterium]|nr:tyrosine-protein phosphatase [Pseudomonadota bacterium]
MTPASAEPALPLALALEGASNVRDLGGWPTADGRHVRFGLVFRSAALSGLSADGAERLAATGLRTVCDLRGTKEQAEAPSPLAALPLATSRSLPIEPSVGASLRDLVATGAATGENVLTVMRHAYVAYALDWSHRYRDLFELLLRDDGLPLLFHCSAGKDRTGFGAALILAALGARREVIREDYLASNRLWRGDAGIAEGLPPDVASTLLAVHAELLDAGFAAIEQSFHSFDRYAAMQLGLPEERRQRLRERLLE